jgi:hypothetical protein
MNHDFMAVIRSRYGVSVPVPPINLARLSVYYLFLAALLFALTDGPVSYAAGLAVVLAWLVTTVIQRSRFAGSARTLRMLAL